MITDRGDMIENSHIKEKDLVLAARGGDRDAFNELMVLGANLFHGENEYTTFGGFEHNDNVYLKFTYGI